MAHRAARLGHTSAQAVGALSYVKDGPRRHPCQPPPHETEIAGKPWQNAEFGLDGPRRLRVLVVIAADFNAGEPKSCKQIPDFLTRGNM